MGTVHAHDAVMDACVRSGIRAVSGKAMMDAGDGVPEGLRETTRGEPRGERATRAGLARRGRREDRVRVRAAVHPLVHREARAGRASSGPRATARSFTRTSPSTRTSARRCARALGDDDVAVLRAWGVKGPRAILAHGVQLTDDEARAIAADETRVVHCPSANLKLGSGIARVAELDALRRASRARR